MNTTEFFQWFNEGIEPLSRIIVCATRDDVKEVRKWFQNKQAHIVGVSSCVTEREWYPMPPEVSDRLKAEITNDGMTVVCGLDGYAGILGENPLNDLYAELKTWIDDGEPAALLVVCETVLPELRKVFSNPRYASGNRVIYVRGASGNAALTPLPTIYLVVDRWFKAVPPDVKSLHEYFQAYEADTLHGERTRIAIPSDTKHWAGLRGDVRQVVTLKDYMAEFKGVDDPLLSEAALQWIYEQGVPTDASIKAFVTADSIQREIILWKLNQQAKPNTYLRYVLDNGVTTETFFECCVCVASKLLAHPDAKRLAEERKRVMAEIGLQMVEPFIPSFIEMIRTEPAWQKIAWLNNESNTEKAELLRILGGDYSENVRKAVFAIYPEVCAYLSADADSYFTEYRQLKIQGKCTDAFAQKAFECSREPKGVKSRNVLLQEYRDDGETALLVVDGMGAEWLPMIKALAERNGLHVVSALTGYVQLPTITETNKVEWAKERTLPEIKELDNIAHNGAEAHTVKPNEENLRAQLEVISKTVLLAMGQGLANAKHKRVLVTADHGTSRLAICAWNQKIVRTLEIPLGDTEILDWRYCRNAPKSEDLEKPLVGEYAAVRGYNRLPKSGGKGFEVHGGATLEERLVPVIVFEKGLARKNDTVAQPVSELDEVDIFANL